MEDGYGLPIRLKNVGAVVDDNGCALVVTDGP